MEKIWWRNKPKIKKILLICLMIYVCMRKTAEIHFYWYKNLVPFAKQQCFLRLSSELFVLTFRLFAEIS